MPRIPAHKAPIPRPRPRPESDLAVPRPRPRPDGLGNTSVPRPRARPDGLGSTVTGTQFERVGNNTNAAAELATVENLVHQPMRRLSGSYVDALRGVNTDVGDYASRVKPDPLEILGSVQNGDVSLSLPLPESLLKEHKLKGKDAHVSLRLVVRDGKLDMDRTQAQIQGVRGGPLNAIKLEGAYFDDQGKLRAKIFGPDINLSKKLFGTNRVPAGMRELTQALKAKHGGNSGGAGRSGGSGLREKLDGLPTSFFDQVKLDARGVSFDAQRPISLGGNNVIDFQPGSRFDLRGNLNDLSLSGRVKLDRMKLEGARSGIALGQGDVALQATMRRAGNGLNVDVALDRATVNVDALSHRFGGDEAVDVQGARLSNGKIRASLQLDAGGKPRLRRLDTEGSLNASQLSYQHNGEVAFSGRGLHTHFSVKEERDAQGRPSHEISLNDLDGQIDNMTLRSPQGEFVQVKDAHIENGRVFQHIGPSGPSGVPMIDLPSVQGTVAGSVRVGSAQAGKVDLHNARIEGGLRLDDGGLLADIKTRDLDVEGDELHLKHGEHSLNVDHARFSGNGGLVSTSNGVRVEGQGTVNASLHDGYLSLGEHGHLDIGANTRAELEVLSAHLGDSLQDGRFSASGRLDGSLDNASLREPSLGGIDLQNTDFSIDVKEVEKREGESLPRFRGDVQLRTDLEAHMEKALRTRLGDANIGTIEGKTELQLKDAQFDGQGRLQAEHAGVKLDAQIGEIHGKLNLDPASVLRPTSAGSNGVSATGGLQGPALVNAAPKIDAPLAIDPMAVARRIQNGTLNVEIPIQQAGIEETTKLLGIQTVDVKPGTKLHARLAVKDGKIQYDKSTLRLNKPIEALGLFDVNIPRINDKGEVVLGVAGRDINISSWVVGRDRLPGQFSRFVDEIVSPQTSSAGASGSTSGSSLNNTLSEVNRFANVGGIKLSAKDVSLAPGRLQIGDDDFIELDGTNKVNIAGNAQEMKISGEIPAERAYIDVGGSRLDITDGNVSFDANIKTGLSRNGRFSSNGKVDVNFRIPDAQIQELEHQRENGDGFSLREGRIQDASLSMSHDFRVQDDGSMRSIGEPTLNLDVGHFAGRLGNSTVSLQNPDGSVARVAINDAQGSGSLHVSNDGIQANLNVDGLDARIEDLDLQAAGQIFDDLDGSLRGQGTLSLDTQKGLTLEGDFLASASVQDARLHMGNHMELDLAKDSRTNLTLRRLQTGGATPQLDADLSLDASLDNGTVNLSGQPIRFAKGSELQLTTSINSNEQGPSLTMNGRILARLRDQQALKLNTNDASLNANVDKGWADIDLGDISLNSDGTYHIKNPNVSLSLDLSKLDFYR